MPAVPEIRRSPLDHPPDDVLTVGIERNWARDTRRIRS